VAFAQEGAQKFVRSYITSQLSPGGVAGCCRIVQTVGLTHFRSSAHT
jgi:hypothetical protein